MKNEIEHQQLHSTYFANNLFENYTLRAWKVKYRAETKTFCIHEMMKVFRICEHNNFMFAAF